MATPTAALLGRHLSRLAELKRMLSSSLLPEKPTAYIGGQWVPAQSGAVFDVTNPANGESLHSVANCSEVDVRAAIAAATLAQSSWGFTTAKERGAILTRLHALHIHHKKELAAILTQEMGKPLAEAEGEIMYSAGFLDWYAAEGRRAYGDIVPAPAPDRHILATVEPIGVAGIITPWNFPSAMIVRKAAAALAAGCAVVIKPAEDTPLSALAIAKLCEEAGVPAGVVNVVPSDRAGTPAVGAALCESPDVATISFTGSTQVGKILLQQSASTVKRVSLELGGNAPFIVLDSADVAAAVRGAMGSKFRCSGQTCVCSNRFFVQAGVHDEFVKALKAAMIAELKVGNGAAPGVTQGPLVNARAVDKVSGLVEDAVAKGAAVVHGGARATDSGPNFYHPTLLQGITSEMEIASTEIFGPVAAVVKFDTEEEVLRLANNCRHGLAGYFYSQDVSQIFRVARRLEVGMVGVNEGLLSTPEAPFGGVKESGLGTEGGKWGLSEFTQTKYVCIGGLKL